MSHFAVLVVTKTGSEQELKAALQPFHEFECTGEDDQYVQEIDKTEEAREEYQNDTRSVLVDTEGKRHSPCEDEFYRDPTEEEAKSIGIGGTGWNGTCSYTSRDWKDGKGYRAKVRFIPDGWQEIEVPTSELESFRDFVQDYYGWEAVQTIEKPDTQDKDKHKYGYCLIDAKGEVVKCIDRTNPNKQWDWWQIGGRYSGKLRSRRRPQIQIDGCFKADLDFASMKNAQEGKRRDWIHECCEKAKMEESELQEALQQKFASEPLWQALDEPRPRGGDYHSWLADNGFGLLAKASRANWDLPEVRQGQTLAEWVAEAPAVSAFAVLDQNGQWHEKGDMGWWGCVRDEKDDWPMIFNDLFDKIPDDHYLTIVDCHI